MKNTKKRELIPCPWKNEDCEHSTHEGRICEQGSFDVCPEELKELKEEESKKK